MTLPQVGVRWGQGLGAIEEDILPGLSFHLESPDGPCVSTTRLLSLTTESWNFTYPMVHPSREGRRRDPRGVHCPTVKCPVSPPTDGGHLRDSPTSFPRLGWSHRCVSGVLKSKGPVGTGTPSSTHGTPTPCPPRRGPSSD